MTINKKKMKGVKSAPNLGCVGVIFIIQ